MDLVPSFQLGYLDPGAAAAFLLVPVLVVVAAAAAIIFTLVRSRKPAAGWLADPWQPGQLRWWDGQQWTSHIAPGVDPAAEPPPVQKP